MESNGIVGGFGPDQHRFLPPTEATAGATGELRNALASRARVRASRVYVGLDGDTVLCRVLQAVLEPGARVALALPTAADHVRQVLAVGASYIDMGCDFRFVPRQDRLERLLADEAVGAVLLATPNPLSGVDSDPPKPNSAWLIIDRRADVAIAPQDDPRGRVISVFQDGPVTWVVAPEEVATRLRQLGPEPLLSDALATAAATTPPRPAEAVDIAWPELERLGLVTSASTRPWALVRQPGRSARELAERCDNANITGSTQGLEHQSGRDAVRLQWPGREGIARLAAALIALSACGGAPAPAGAPAAAGATAPAPKQTRPAPTVTAAAKEPPPGVKKDLHRAPIVGGCGELCREARDAVSGFAAALVASDRHARLPLYLDSSQLVIDGDEVGARLAQMWLRGEVSPRLQALGEVVEDLGRAAKGADEAALLAHAEQAAFREQRPRSAVMELALPRASWTLTLGRRGLEWLVTGIRTR